jgi:DNA repair exonuclease SbcCD ATPase subunit
MFDPTLFRRELERRRGKQTQLQHELALAKSRFKEFGKELSCCEEAQIAIQEIAKKTQGELTYRLDELVTLAMAAVFDDPYELEVDFVQRRGRTEADIWFRREGKRIHPTSASGGGAVDVASFALRVALWSLAQPRTRPVLILDEPLHFLKGDSLPEKGSAMIAEISKKLGIQIIMVSHIPDQISQADRKIEVQLKNGVSRVT